MHCRKIVFEEYGDPMKVVSLVEQMLPDKLDDKQVLVKMIVTPVNPADTIQGVYHVKPPLPATVDYEGIGNVLAIGLCVKNLCPGDRVMPDGAMGADPEDFNRRCSNKKKVGKWVSLCSTIGYNWITVVYDGWTTDLFRSEILPKPRLGINNLGGNCSTEVLHTLNNSGVMVTYGGISREPVIVPTASFIFKDIQLRGFWMTRWCKENVNTEQYNQMYDEILQLIKDGKLVAPAYKTLPLKSLKVALKNTISSKGFIGHKYFLDLQ